VEVKKRASEFAKRSLNDEVIRRDRESAFSRELWNRCAEFGVQGFSFPARYGGTQGDIVSAMLLMEGLGYGCRDAGLLFAINGQMWTVQMPIFMFGTDAQKDRYLSKLCGGEWIAGNGMTEPGSGSDAFSLTTTARRDGDGYVLNGNKIFCTNAPVADLFLVYATVDKRKGFFGVTVFLVERGTPGLTVGRDIDKMGLRTAPMAELAFEDCRVPAASRLGGEGNGAAIFESGMEWERGCILASVIGNMERQLETCTQYARDRHQFGKPIGKNQSVANKIVDMKVRLETSRLLIYNLATIKQQGRKATLEAAMAKLHLSECWVQSCLDAVQVHGAYGYTTEYEVERDLRDAVASRIYSGTSEIQRNIIARSMNL
jgi:alkylation response protein AidB-like acyl-CoA dehydrogenase